MVVRLNLQLQEREADAFLAAYEEGRKGWHAIPSLALQRADFRIVDAIIRDRAEKQETD